MTKAVFFDIDGTLLDDVGGITSLTERVKAALKRLKSAGHHIFIATGRPYAFLQKELLNFGFDGYVLLNGALIMLDGKIIFKQALDNAVVKKICDYVVSEDIEYMLEGHPQIYYKREFKAVEAFFHKINVDYSDFVRDFEIDDKEIFKIECRTFRNDSDNLNAIYEKINAMEGIIGWSDPFRFRSLEISSNKITKADGIFCMLNHIGVDVKNSYAFGDGYNDIDMIQRVGTGIAMGTGSEELKRKAKFVVPSVHEDGVAIGIEKYML